MSVNICGKVIKGKNKGKKLGFPTANIELKKKIESGIYAGRVRLNEKEYQAGIFVSPDGKILEAHLIEFSGDLYGREIEIEIGGKIREVRKFGSDEELKKQVQKDIGLIKSQNANRKAKNHS